MIDFKARTNEFIDWDMPRISLSKSLGYFSAPFDQECVAQKTYNKHFNNPSSQYYQMTVEQIIDAWHEKGQQSLHYGKLSDEYIDNVFTKSQEDLETWKFQHSYDYNERLRNNCISFDHFKDWFSDDWEFIDREQSVYYKIPNYDLIISGRFDALFRNKVTGKWLIIDWKTSGSIDKKTTPWTTKMFGPLYMYPALNWYTYTIQVYFYKKALIDMGYIKDANYDDIECAIVDLPGKVLESGQDFEYIKPAFQYNNDLMNNVFDFIYRSYMIEQKQEQK